MKIVLLKVPRHTGKPASQSFSQFAGAALTVCASHGHTTVFMNTGRSS